MKALVTTGDGHFSLKEVAVPVPGAGEILISVATIAQNHVDWKYLVLEPDVKGVIMGWDFAGTVSQLGPDCPNIKLGQRVAGSARGDNGAFAEYLIILADLTISLPANVSFEAATGLGTACISACQCLYQEFNIAIPSDSTFHESDKESILIWSGASSVGQYAIQLAKLSGMKVISTAAPENHELIKSLGADEVFDHSDSWTARRIFETTGGTLVKAIDCWSQGMSPNQVSMSLSTQGGTIATMLPYESLKRNVKTSCVLVNSIHGQDTSFPLVTTGNPDHTKNGKLYCKMISTLLAQNKLKFVPVKLYPRGLLGVAEGIEYMRLGKAHAEKITYRIGETPRSKVRQNIVL
ncbi:chaperonin 10-like protein [Mycena epipterygia]|nr:chaperonin 10-like protein [Mycena epipterygia]